MSARWAFRRILKGRDRVRESVLTVFDAEAPLETRLDRLDEMLRDAEGARMIAAVDKLRDGESALDDRMSSLAGAAISRRRLAALAKREIKAIRAARRRSGASRVRLSLVPKIAAGAALALVAIVAAIRFVSPPDPAADAVRAGGTILESISPRGETPEGEVEFRWRAVSGVRSYRLEVFDPEMSRVYVREGIDGDRFRPAAADIRPWEGSGPYFWKVTAAMENDQAIESDFSKFSVSRKPPVPRP